MCWHYFNNRLQILQILWIFVKENPDRKKIEKNRQIIDKKEENHAPEITRWVKKYWCFIFQKIKILIPRNDTKIFKLIFVYVLNRWSPSENINAFQATLIYVNNT